MGAVLVFCLHVAGCSLEDCISAEPSYGIDVSYLHPTSVQLVA